MYSNTQRIVQRAEHQTIKADLGSHIPGLNYHWTGYSYSELSPGTPHLREQTEFSHITVYVQPYFSSHRNILVW